MSNFDKMMKDKKKKGSEMSDNEQKAKMGVVKDMRDMASEEMGKRLHGMKKVSVMSDSKEGLSKGLDKAKELMAAIHGSGNASPDSMDDEETNAEGTNQAHKTYQGGEGDDEPGQIDSDAEEAAESPEEEKAEQDKMEEDHGHKSSDELANHIKKLQEMHSKKKHEESFK